MDEKSKQLWSKSILLSALKAAHDARSLLSAKRQKRK